MSGTAYIAELSLHDFQIAIIKKQSINPGCHRGIFTVKINTGQEKGKYYWNHRMVFSEYT